MRYLLLLAAAVASSACSPGTEDGTPLADPTPTCAAPVGTYHLYAGVESVSAAPQCEAYPKQGEDASVEITFNARGELQPMTDGTTCTTTRDNCTTTAVCTMPDTGAGSIRQTHTYVLDPSFNTLRGGFTEEGTGYFCPFFQVKGITSQPPHT